MVTRMYGDYHCYPMYQKNNAKLDGFFNVALTNNTPRVGIGEFGRTTNGDHIPDDTVFDNYTKYLTSEWQAWNAAGHNSAVIMYFTTGVANDPSPANYVSLEALWDALSIDNT